MEKVVEMMKDESFQIDFMNFYERTQAEKSDSEEEAEEEEDSEDEVDLDFDEEMKVED